MKVFTKLKNLFQRKDKDPLSDEAVEWLDMEKGYDKNDGNVDPLSDEANSGDWDY